MEIIQFYSEKEVIITKTSINTITEMGFDYEETKMALQAMRNNIGAAIEILCGNHNENLTEITEESPILIHLLRSPAIQKSFSDPNVFHGEFLRKSFLFEMHVK